VIGLMAAGAAGVVVAWRLIVAGRATIWTAMAPVLWAAGATAVATGRVPLSPRMSPAFSAVAGATVGVALYAGTVAFVLGLRRWPVFDVHVAEIYGRRGGTSQSAAVGLAVLTAVGEELFWRGLFQSEVSKATAPFLGAVMTWAAYVVANAASASLPIVAGAVVGGATWGALAFWTEGVLASVWCHAVWTALMVVRPPGEAGR
jgi:membrane protease YdiL (CAAX protease family)